MHVRKGLLKPTPNGQAIGNYQLLGGQFSSESWPLGGCTCFSKLSYTHHAQAALNELSGIKTNYPRTIMTQSQERKGVVVKIEEKLEGKEYGFHQNTQCASIVFSNSRKNLN